MYMKKHVYKNYHMRNVASSLRREPRDDSWMIGSGKGDRYWREIFLLSHIVFAEDGDRDCGEREGTNKFSKLRERTPATKVKTLYHLSHNKVRPENYLDPQIP